MYCTNNIYFYFLSNPYLEAKVKPTILTEQVGTQRTLKHIAKNYMLINIILRKKFV